MRLARGSIVIETLDPFGPVLAADYPRYTCATAIVETAERLTSEERQPTLRLYLLVVSALRDLTETGRDPSLVLDAFLLRAMALAGWAPALVHGVLQRLGVERGELAVDVRVQQSYFVAHFGERYRQVHRQRGFADASLTRPDGDD